MIYICKTHRHRRSNDSSSKRKRIRFCTEAFHNPVFENSLKALAYFTRILEGAGSGKNEQKLVGAGVVVAQYLNKGGSMFFLSSQVSVYYLPYILGCPDSTEGVWVKGGSR